MASVKPSSWAAKRAGTLNKFYTREEVGDLLAAELGSIAPHTVVDLGSGEGSLSCAVVRRWPDVNVTTVDIDGACVPALHERLLALGAKSHEHHQLDVLDSQMPGLLGQSEYDLAVCNPPFFRPKWDPAFARILQAADFAEACEVVTEGSAEILFFAQNLRLIRDGGSIALIVPDGLATGWRHHNFRKALIDKHTLRAVIQLPPYSFMDTEAYCFVLIVTKERSAADHRIKLLRLEEDGSASDSIWITPKVGERRLDWAYHSTAAHGDEAFTLRQLGAEIRRGSLSSAQRRAASFPVFHTGDFPKRGELVTLTGDPDETAGKKLIVAEAGDILMARVDRELHNKITFVASGRMAVTDCIYRIRVPKEHQQRVFAALTSKVARDRIIRATKGVGARLLGKGELLDLPLTPPA